MWLEKPVVSLLRTSWQNGLTLVAAFFPLPTDLFQSDKSSFGAFPGGAFRNFAADPGSATPGQES